MMKTITLTALALLLSACAGGFSGNGSSEMYGQISTGIESSHTSVGR
ncbi:hypothetical protein [Neisseria perflava]|nr:hypothetical protein [Neisseria perflava]MCP1660060.1 hypothetical protein [Neisseria perflava]MCP1773433.1 hypothetical protein [Neisseria perflava]